MPKKKRYGWVLPNTYTQRNLTLRQMGYKTYRIYLLSPLWESIRDRVFALRGRVCCLCGNYGEAVHHKSYDKATLLGTDISQLVVVCNACHRKIEFSRGKKRTLAESQAKFHALRFSK